MNVANTGVVRINVTVPRRLLSELEKEVPGRGKSGFVSEAIEEKLARQKKEQAFKELAKLPATFTHIKDGAEYVRGERTKEQNKRSARLGV